MKLTLFSPDAFSSVVLPSKCAGQFWLTGKNASGAEARIIAVEGVRSIEEEQSDQWILRSNSRFKIMDRTGQEIQKLVIDALSVYVIRSVDGAEEYRLYSEPVTDDRKTYRAYKLLRNAGEIRIGRSAECDIRYSSGYIGKLHATITVSGSSMAVRDNDSLNRTFVNGFAVQHAELNYGDVLYMMGMQIIISNGYLYINDPDGKVAVSSRMLQEYHEARYTVPEKSLDEVDTYDEFDDYYYRAPRFKRDIEPFELKLDPPPSGQHGENMPLLMSIGPSITMGMASATTAAFSVVNAMNSGNPSSAIPSVVMSMGMLCGTMLWPTLTKSYQKKTAEQKEAKRQSAYKNYLDQMERRIDQEIARQEQILRDNDRSYADYLGRVNTQPLHIWERTPKHTDFLRIRLGLGELPLQGQLQYSERRFSVEQDDLQEAMYQFGEKERWLRNVPICLPLTERFVCGYYASHDTLMACARDLILQLTVLHSYDEVKLVVLYDEADEEDMSFVRWLPHTMDDDRRIRYIASTPEEAKELSADLEQIVEYRSGLNAEQLADEKPYFLVLSLSKKLSAKTESLRKVLQSKENIGFSFVAMYERLKDLPKECSAVVRVESSGNGTLTILNNVSEAPISFRTEMPAVKDLLRVTEVLANTLLDVNETSFKLPRKYTFMEMLDIGMVEHLNLLENWSVNDPTKSLAAPIGIDAYGDPFVLDLHERAHGPHGLIAGMTGSGKSETIIAYILSMAINYHPNEVAFILIDYKGGGMAKAFENIPHTAGIITNLDGNEINRSLVSMQSELHRRERIFRNVSKQHGISNIDIYKYQKLYREGKVEEPLPHLIIVSDEFAELKKDQPDFMAALTSTARVGRSLGVHLILATQKPGGVVDDQIRSNSRFRLCLKVQDRGDSTEMMGRPEAASLVETGRFYLQVGNNELFELGQSAWAGASYYPAAKAYKDPDDALCVIDKNGRTLVEINTDPFAHIKQADKQLDVITDHIRRISEEEQIKPWKMWLDPIPARIYTQKLREKYKDAHEGGFSLNPIVGEYDDPASQKQYALQVPITESGNVILYGAPGSGKTMFLETMCHSIMSTHTPDEANLYILDFGGETMTAFVQAPHVGDVVLSHESEKIENLFRLLGEKLRRRKKILSRIGGTIAMYNEQAGEKEPNIVVVINNYANFFELYEERQADLAYLTREGTRYGIYFVLACTGVNNVRMNLQQNFKTVYCLQMNNSSDYSVIVGKTGGLLPGKHMGRGIYRFDKDTVLEFQTAQVTDRTDTYAFWQEFSRSLKVRYAKKTAQGIPVLPNQVTMEFLAKNIDPNNLGAVPVGVEKRTMKVHTVDMAARPIHVILSEGDAWKGFTDSLTAMLSQKYHGRTILLAPGADVSTVEQFGSDLCCTDQNGCCAGVDELFDALRTRRRACKTAAQEGKRAPSFERLFVIVRSVSALKNLLGRAVLENPLSDDDSMVNRFQLAVEKCTGELGITVILADEADKMRSFAKQPMLASQFTGRDFIWIGSSLNSQYWLTVSKKPKEYTAALGRHFGYAVINGEAILVKFLQEQEEEA